MITVPVVDPEIAKQYHADGWWGDLGVADYVARNAAEAPDEVAIVTERSRVTWATYDQAVDELAVVLASRLERQDRFGAVFPDCPEFHYALCAGERSGTIAVGIGARSEFAEIHHLLTKSGARGLVMRPEHQGQSARELFLALVDGGVPLTTLIVHHGDHVELFSHDGSTLHAATPDPVSRNALTARRFSPDEVSMLNSTSGTTGRPKLVTQFANRWICFSEMAFDAGALTGDDIILGAVPGPFGFGLWTAHYAPAMLRCKVVLMERFDIGLMLRLIESEKATMIACVSTQFKMMLDAIDEHDADVSSLRVMFTGGEAVPYERAREFEERIGAQVLQFYGSNEGGAVTNTNHTDTPERRLMTAGRLSPGVTMKLLDGEKKDVTASGGPGQPAVTGPTITLGYFNDAAANAELFRDGLLLMPDIVTLDEDGYMKVVGRTSDLIIRGGKNISAVEVEEAVEMHPSVKMAAAVPVPDDLFGERIGVAVELAPGATLELADLTDFLRTQGCSKMLLPEHLLIVEDIPRAQGGKIAKGLVKRLFV